MTDERSGAIEAIRERRQRSMQDKGSYATGASLFTWREEAVAMEHDIDTLLAALAASEAVHDAALALPALTPSTRMERRSYWNAIQRRADRETMMWAGTLDMRGWTIPSGPTIELPAPVQPLLLSRWCSHEIGKCTRRQWRNGHRRAMKYRFLNDLMIAGTNFGKAYYATMLGSGKTICLPAQVADPFAARIIAPGIVQHSLFEAVS